MSNSASRSAAAIAFSEKLPKSLRKYASASGVELLRVPAVSKEVGDLVVTDDGDALTVEVGKVFHSHFPVEVKRYFCADPATVHVVAANAALYFVEEVLAQRLRFKLTSVAGRIVSAETIVEELDIEELDAEKWDPDPHDPNSLASSNAQADVEVTKIFTWRGECK